MLIKLCEGARLDNVKTQIEPGAKFLRYLLPDVYDRGEVVEVGEATFRVDFADTIREFRKDDCALVFGSVHGEHLMTKVGGEVIKDFRHTHKGKPPEIELEDLLDFDKWFG